MVETDGDSSLDSHTNAVGDTRLSSVLFGHKRILQVQANRCDGTRRGDRRTGSRVSREKAKDSMRGLFDGYWPGSQVSRNTESSSRAHGRPQYSRRVVRIRLDSIPIRLRPYAAACGEQHQPILPHLGDALNQTGNPRHHQHRRKPGLRRGNECFDEEPGLSVSNGGVAGVTLS